MKGLLLKDLYMIAKNCRMSIAISIVFALVSLFNMSNFSFFLLYPCMICGMIPVTLLGYDERMKWIEYSGTLPCSRAQLVSVKYLIGLICQSAMMLLILIGYTVKNMTAGTFRTEEFVSILLMLISVSLLATAISLPFIFKLGIEKGRVAYFISLGIVALLCVAGASLITEELPDGVDGMAILAAACAVSAVIYAASWYLSVVFYKRREL